MKKLLLISIALMLAGCVAYPLYDDGYYYPDYGQYPYGYAGSNVNLYFSNFHGGRVFHKNGHGSLGGRHDFHRSGHRFHGGGHNSHGGGHNSHGGGHSSHGSGHAGRGRR